MEKQEIKKFCNMYMWSDVHPFEVVKIVSDRTVEVRGMNHEQTVFPKDVHIGGFLAHTADNHRQAYEYESDESKPTIRVRWSKAMKRWQSAGGNRFIMEDRPIYFYDYNF